MEERRQGYQDILTAIQEHATESKIGMARLEERISEQGRTIERVGAKVDSNSEDAASIRSTVESIRNQTADQWEELKTQGAQIAALGGGEKGHGFLSDPYNQKIILSVGAVVVLGLLSLAGYNVSVADVAGLAGE
jgi:hypothetical protein